MFSVYIIYSQILDKYYIGFSSDLEKRLRKHNAISKGFTNLGKPWILMYSEQFKSKKEAMAREKQLKNWKNRERLESLIKTGSEHPDSQVGRVGGSNPSTPTNQNQSRYRLAFVS